MNFDDIIKDYPATTTPINKQLFENVANAILNFAFPINKTVVFYDTEDHSDYLGFTWKLVSKGNFPVGYNPEDTDYNQVGKTGGEKMHKLTISEMPKHSHDVNPGATTFATGGNYEPSQSTGGNRTFTYLTLTSSGENQPHENRPPYEVMAFWRRIA